MGSSTLETSIGLVRLSFTNNLGDPPTVNVISVPAERGGPALFASFRFTADGWVNEGAMFIDRQSAEVPLPLLGELASRIGAWALKNQDRFLSYQRETFYDEFRWMAEALDEFAQEFSRMRDVLERVTRAGSAEPRMIETARYGSAALLQMQAAIADAKTVFSFESVGQVLTLNLGY